MFLHLREKIFYSLTKSDRFKKTGLRDNENYIRNFRVGIDMWSPNLLLFYMSMTHEIFNTMYHYN